ncbi:hypothetical protein GCM10022631_29810 [Deinococcus rubellus]|uniref:TerD family protein n=1 Tax=Deinococcus rubellus TaxID=1889240 RepID=UPI0031ED2605
MTRPTLQPSPEDMLAPLQPRDLTRASLLLRRTGRVEVGTLPTGNQDEGGGHRAGEDLLLAFLEAGALPSQALADMLLRVSPALARAVRETGLRAVRESQGAQPSLPQLRNFVQTQVTTSTGEHFLRRVAAFYELGDDDLAHCVLRHDANAATPGTWGTQLGRDPSTLRGCAVGRLGTAVQGTCEICHLRVGDPAQRAALAAADLSRRADRPLPGRSVGLMPAGAQATELLLGTLLDLTDRVTPLSVVERADTVALTALLLAGDPGDPLTPQELLERTTARDIPQREVRALLLGTLLRVSNAPAALLERASRTLGFLPADLLRVLDVMGGGDGTLARSRRTPEVSMGPWAESAFSLQRGNLYRKAFAMFSDLLSTPAPNFDPPPVVPFVPLRTRGLHIQVPHLPRPLRRAVKDALEHSLEGLEGQGVQGATLAWEAVQRYPEAFKALFRRLHVHERPREHARLAALARLLSDRGHAPGDATTPTARRAVDLAAATPGEPTRARTLLGGVELALASRDLSAAVHLLQLRPGLVGRLLDRLLRLEALTAPEAPVTLAALQEAVPVMSASLLASLHAHVERRDKPDPARSFVGKGDVATRSVGDHRPLLSRALINQVQAVIETELLRRAALLPPLGRIEVDPDLVGLRLSASSRHASQGQEGLAAGSALPLTPSGTEPARVARLFLHWAERDGAGSIDLDLSALTLDAAGKRLTRCSFSELQVPGMVHSGDLRSAPLPTGATEYIDLDLEALRAAGAALVIASIHSFTSIPFDQMERAACGVMSRVETSGDHREMDPATTRVRFDLTGPATSKIVAALELRQPGQERLISLDMQGDGGGFQVIEEDENLDLAVELALSGRGVPLSLAVGLHAVRVPQVRLGAIWQVRREDEAPEAFARRVQAATESMRQGKAVDSDVPPEALPGGPTLHVVTRADHDLPEGDTLVQLQPGVAQTRVEARGLRWLLEGLEAR